MIPKKYSAVVFSFWMALLMSSLMSFVVTVSNMGLTPGIVVVWLQAWALAFVIALPAVMVVTPVVRQLVAMVVEG